MLTSLRIENFALIDALTLEFGPGLNVLTGETGAGKSIILDAIDAALGGRISRRFVRTGADRALIEATFQLDSTTANAIAAELDAQEVQEGQPLVCSREMTVSGNSVRNRSKVNGAQIKKQQIESLRDRIVEITAQGQTMQLGRQSLQRQWLDGFGGDAVLTQRSTVAAAYTAAQQALQKLEKRRQAEAERLQQLDLFEYQIKELDAAQLEDPEELEQLEQEYQRLSHSVELQQQSYEVYQALYQNEHGGDACADLLGRAEELLEDMRQYDPQIQPILDMVNAALTQVEEAGREINAYGADIETDPSRLQDVEQRISQLKQICRKYGPSLADVIAYSQKIHAELDDLTGGGQSLEDLEQTYEQKQAHLETACQKLTELRLKTARQLEKQLIEELKPLAMDKVQFTVDIAPTAPSSSGADRVTFLFSPNPGEPPQPLDEVASGGEMSRFLLAFKSCFSQADAVGTMVFDEIDVGVSGRVAQAIAEKLHHLSQRHQVLCVTHQPLVAAMADHHFRVNKQVVDESATAKNGKTAAIAPTTDMPDTAANTATNTAANTAADDVRTVVRVEPLSTDQRREELALLAGGQSAQDAMPFADALLVQADTIRQARQNGSSANQSKVDPSKPDPSKPESTAAKSSSVRSASTQSSTQPSAKSSAKSSTKSSAGKSGKARSQSKSKS